MRNFTVGVRCLKLGSVTRRGKSGRKSHEIFQNMSSPRRAVSGLRNHESCDAPVEATEVRSFALLRMTGLRRLALLAAAIVFFSSNAIADLYSAPDPKSAGGIVGETGSVELTHALAIER